MNVYPCPLAIIPLDIDISIHNEVIEINSKDHIDVEIYDAQGKVVFQSANSKNIVVNKTNYTSGNYLIKVITKDGKTTYKSFICGSGECFLGK